MPDTVPRRGTAFRARLAGQTALAAVLWGCVGPLVAVLPANSYSGFALMRLGVGALLLGLLAVRSQARRRFSSRDLPGLLVGGVAVASFQPLYFQAIDLAGVAVATFVAIGLSPVITGLAVWCTTRRPPTRRWALSAALAVTGLWLLGQATGPGAARLSVLGIGLALVACVSYSFQALSIAHVARSHGETRAVGAIFVIAALMLMPTAVTADFAWAGQPQFLMAGIFAGVATLALAYRLFARGVHGLGSPTAVLISLLEPVTAAAFAVLLLGDPITVTTGVAMTLILAGVATSVTDRPAAGPAITPP